MWYAVEEHKEDDGSWIPVGFRRSNSKKRIEEIADHFEEVFGTPRVRMIITMEKPEVPLPVTNN